MDATLSLYSATLAAGDPTQNSNPSLRYVDWKRQIQNVPVSNPRADSYAVPANSSLAVFNGTRATSLDGTSAFSIAPSVLDPTRYRITSTGGTNPTIRADRGVNASGVVLTLVAQANGSLVMTAGAGTPFAAVQVGDQVFIPGLLTGDAATPFNPINEGLWSVIGASGAALTLVRPAGQSFSGYSEVVTPAAAGQLLAFAAAGVQAGDSVEISSGFSAATFGNYLVTEVTSKWFEIQSTVPLASESGITPGVAGLVFYSSCKRFLRIEADQQVAVQLNGDTGTTQRIQPWLPGDPAQVGEYVKVGPAWSLVLVNRSTATANVTVISAE